MKMNMLEQRYEFPTIKHLPYSEQKSDEKLQDDQHWIGERVVVTLKLDGKNLTGYRDGLEVRSSNHSNPTDLVTSLWNEQRWKVEPGLRVTLEDMEKKQTIHYGHDLTNLLYIHSIWEKDTCLDWSNTLLWAARLNFPTTPLIYWGSYSSTKIMKAYNEFKDKSSDPVEGFIIRTERTFKLEDIEDNWNQYVDKEFLTLKAHDDSSSNDVYNIINNRHYNP